MSFEMLTLVYDNLRYTLYPTAPLQNLEGGDTSHRPPPEFASLIAPQARGYCLLIRSQSDVYSIDFLCVYVWLSYVVVILRTCSNAVYLIPRVSAGCFPGVGKNMGLGTKVPQWGTGMEPRCGSGGGSR